MPPRKTVEPSKGSNKIRFVMLEADLCDGNLSELTQAITNALKPAQPAVRYISAPPPKTLDASTEPSDNDDHDEPAEIVEEDAETPVAPIRAAKATSKKKFKQPDLIELNWAGTKGTGLKEFAKEKAPKSRSRKYLVAAFWLKEHGGCPTVNVDKMYSCFRTAGWSVAFQDWSQTFRNLVHTDHLRKAGTSGEFSITTLGEGLLEKAED